MDGFPCNEEQKGHGGVFRFHVTTVKILPLVKFCVASRYYLKSLLKHPSLFQVRICEARFAAATRPTAAD